MKENDMLERNINKLADATANAFLDQRKKLKEIEEQINDINNALEHLAKEIKILKQTTVQVNPNDMEFSIYMPRK